MAKYTLLAATTCALSFAAFANDAPITPKEIQLNSSPIEKKVRAKSPSVKAAFSPFTGKISAEKVRLRLQPDLDGGIVQQLEKNDLVSIIDQEGDFYVVEPPESIKAFVFRSFVLDNVIEGNRVNVRLEPDLESPVIGHLNSGDRVDGEVSEINRKWLEIAPPPSSRFYVAKEFIDYVGGPEHKAEMAKRKQSVEQLLEAADLFAQAELEKPFEAIEFDRVKQGYLSILHDYTDFPRKAQQAKEKLATVQEQYLQKRIGYLEQKAALISASTPVSTETKTSISLPSVQMWEPIENALYAGWAKAHENKDKEDFYSEQKMVAVAVTGVLEAFSSPIRNKPGEYVVKNKNLPVAYVYSTKVDLNQYIGKRITVMGSPRDNHNFAFPAYFVHEVE